MTHSGQDFRPRVVRAIEQVALFASLLAAVSIAVSGAGVADAGSSPVLLGLAALGSLAVFFLLLAWRWQAEWIVYGAEAAFVGVCLYYRAAHPLPDAVDAMLLVLLCFFEFGVSQALERWSLNLYARPTVYFSLLAPLLPLLLSLRRGRFDEVDLLILFSTATFYGVACLEKHWKSLGYASAVLYNAFLWLGWSHVGWTLADHPQFYLIPAGLSAILFAEVNERELGRKPVNVIRAMGSMVIYVSTAVPMWQFRSFGAWLMLLLLSLGGIFAGIGLRVQSCLWLGLVCFLFDLLYQLALAGMEYALARWAIMLALGLSMVLFVALNEKKRIVDTMRGYYEQVRQWD
jgi:hypothetical protein